MTKKQFVIDRELHPESKGAGMNEEWVEKMDRVIKGYARTVKLGTVSILSDDVDGMTYVGRWIRTDMLYEINKQAEQNGGEL